VRAVWLLQFCMLFTNNLDIDACVSMLLPSSFFFLIKFFVTYTAIRSILYHFVPFFAVVLAICSYCYTSTWPVTSLLFHFFPSIRFIPLHVELNPNCHLLVLLGARHILHVSRIRVKNYCQLAAFNS